MKTNLTEIVFLLDRSGSMGGLETDTIGGFNAFIDKQVRTEGDTLLTAVLFDDKYEVLWDGVDARTVKLTEEEYYVKGSTALLDAVGKAILDVRKRLSKTPEDDRPGKVIVVIVTDGLENASLEFTYEKVKELIRFQQEKDNWEFIFLGANIDAVGEAKSIGIEMQDAYSFETTRLGMGKMYSQINEAVMERRTRRKR